MEPLATNGTIGEISNGTIGRIPNARIDFQRNAGITDYRMVGHESFDRAALPGHFGPKPFQPGSPQPKSFVFIRGLLGPAAFSGNNIDFGTSFEDKRTVSEYHKQTNVLHSRYTLKDCEGKLKGMPGSTTIKETARMYN